jgi:hypothetical protein
MAFSKTGIVSAPKIVPSTIGLLAVVKPENAPSENQWIRGFSQEWETTVQSLKNWDDSDSTSGSVVSSGIINYYDEIKPFFIELEETRSALTFNGIDRIARLSRQLEGMTQKAMEFELWDGDVRKGESHDNKALTSSTARVLDSGNSSSVDLALALLEGSIGFYSNSGEQGVIHMTRSVASLLRNRLEESNDGTLVTRLGTPVIIGAGYSGNGPDGDENAAQSATNKWIYATGTVKTYLGDVDVVNDNLSQAYDVSGNANDMKIKAIRPAAAYFDPSIHLAVRVNLAA